MEVAEVVEIIIIIIRGWQMHLSHSLCVCVCVCVCVSGAVVVALCGHNEMCERGNLGASFSSSILSFHIFFSL